MLNNIGLVYHDTGRFTEAILFYQRSIEIKKELKEFKSLSASYENLGVTYERFSEYTKAMEVYFLSLKISEEIGDDLRMATTYQNIGIIYSHQNDYENALITFKKALELRSGNDHPVPLIQIKNNIALTLKALHQYEEAVRYFEDCLKLSESIGFLPGETAAYNGLGEVYQELAELEKALQYFMKCYLISKQDNDMVVQLSSAINLGDVYLSMKDYEKAQNYLQEGLNLSKDMGYKGKEQVVYKLLTKLYEETGDLKKALDNYKLYDELKSDILSAQKANDLNKLRLQYEVDKKEKEAILEREKNAALKIAHERADALLRNILPDEVAEELKQNGKAEARLFENTSVLFTDFKDFTLASSKLSPRELVSELNECFTAFDEIVSKYNIEKIKTMGDAYMAASGLPIPNPKHAEEIVRAAIEMRDFIANRNIQNQKHGRPRFEMRMGINSGYLVAGIVGVKKFAYDIWGDTVNTAARMEQNGEAGKINISQTTYDLVKDIFNCQYRGEIEAKNKGKLKMYFVD